MSAEQQTKTRKNLLLFYTSNISKQKLCVWVSIKVKVFVKKYTFSVYLNQGNSFCNDICLASALYVSIFMQFPGTKNPGHHLPKTGDLGHKSVKYRDICHGVNFSKSV